MIKSLYIDRKKEETSQRPVTGSFEEWNGGIIMEMDDAKLVGRYMNIMMGVLMSFSLSLVGNIVSGHFSIPGFITSFIISLVISVMLGFVVRIGQINQNVGRRFDLQPGTIKTRIVESLISDLIYTPLLTFIMVAYSVSMAIKNSGGKAQISILSEFLHSLWICFIVGFVLIFIFQPIILKISMKKAGIDPQRPERE